MVTRVQNTGLNRLAMVAVWLGKKKKKHELFLAAGKHPSKKI